MKLSARLLIFMIICTLLMQCVQAEDANNSNTGQNSAVAIELTKFDVNDTTLELAWKIINNTDHDVWICDKIVHGDSYDRFLDPDNETLIIRKRFDLPPGQGWEHLPRGYYVRLHSGQEIVDSISLSVPIEPYTWFNPLRGNAEYAGRVTLEIGFYDEDLPGSILEIVDFAEKLSYDDSAISIFDPNINVELYHRYFGGVTIEKYFNSKSFEYFSNSITSGGDEVIIPYMWQALKGEQVLWLEIDNVSIPYESDYPPLENQDVNEPSELQDVEESAVSMELTHFEITDANLELGWNIKNNTDHDVWICNSLSQDPSFSVFENFLNTDNKTLIISRRFALPMQEGRLMNYPPLRSRYKLLHAGQERQESISLIVPVEPYLVSSRESGNAEYAGRLSVEIGFYDEDLPSLILKTVELTEHYNCNLEVGVPDPNDPEYLEICYRFFVGRNIAQFFKYSLGWSYSVTSGEDDIWMPYVGLNTGEKVLHLTVEGISLPYKSDYSPLTSE